jgi:cobalt-zinc-cadmium efflux system membrane fusion protein
MTERRRLHVSPGAAAAAMLSMLMVGVGGTYLLIRDDRRPVDATRDSPPETSSTPRGEVVIILSRDAIARAGIEVTPVSDTRTSDSLRVPGVVEPNAYRQVAVTPLVGGRVIQVTAQLGDRVRKGRSIAQIYSPELAEARTKYVTARAMLDAHDRELQRTVRLVEIGAASRQELERLHAEHAAQTAEVESARSRLRLLGAAAGDASPSTPQESGTTNVPAPIDGVVTERLANPGSSVDPSTRLFTIVDLSTVWIVGDVYERDLQRVRDGARATVTTTAYPSQPFAGRVSYIDPQLNAATRTAKVRVEVANARGELRLGMYTDMEIESPGTTAVLAIPRAAVQSVGDAQVVYVSTAIDPTKFIERAVRLGRSAGDRVEVLAGLSAGESVVSRGSFFVRAEAERLGLRSPRSSSASPGSSAMTGATAIHTANIAVTSKGFEPERVTMRAGERARLTFIRTTDQTCATEIVFPSLDLRRALPLNQPVAVELTPSKAGDIMFVCGMNMFKGVAVVQ